MHIFKISFVVLFVCQFSLLAADTTAYIKVHFLYGSKPKREFRDNEQSWFGGIHGGHVGIEIDTNLVIDFVPSGEFHLVEHPNNKHSRFATHTLQQFWELFGSDSGDVKRTSVSIPITKAQKILLDSIVEKYTSEVPYDYAFIGMRCAAAAYDVLAQFNLMKKHSRVRTYCGNFYPKLFRKRLLRKAKKEGWVIRRESGSPKRKWEKDNFRED